MTVNNHTHTQTAEDPAIIPQPLNHRNLLKQQNELSTLKLELQLKKKISKVSLKATV